MPPYERWIVVVWLVLAGLIWLAILPRPSAKVLEWWRISISSTSAQANGSSELAEPPVQVPIHEPLRLTVMMTSYNSLASQTDSTPFITSTGERTRLGIVAASRDLLDGPLPYGTKLRVIRVSTQNASCGGWIPEGILEVQDTMHPRKTNQVDLWLPGLEEALQWGVCQARIEVVASKRGE